MKKIFERKVHTWGIMHVKEQCSTLTCSEHEAYFDLVLKIKALKLHVSRIGSWESHQIDFT